jgi:hypothetical protein
MKQLFNKLSAINKSSPGKTGIYAGLPAVVALSYVPAFHSAVFGAYSAAFGPVRTSMEASNAMQIAAGFVLFAVIGADAAIGHARRRHDPSGPSVPTDGGPR